MEDGKNVESQCQSLLITAAQRVVLRTLTNTFHVLWQVPQSIINVNEHMSLY